MDFIKKELDKLKVPHPESFAFDEKFYRFGKKNEYSLVGKTINYRKKAYSFAIFFDFSGEHENKTFYSFKKNEIPAKIFLNFYSQEIFLKHKAPKEIKDFFEKLPHYKEDHPYLLEKKIIINEDCVFKPKLFKKNLVFPIISLETGTLTGINYLTKKDSVQNLSVYPVRSTPSDTVLLTTSVSAGFHFAQLNTAEIYCCFTLDNLVKVALFLAKKFKNKFIYIMVDNPTTNQLKNQNIKEYKEKFKKNFKTLLNVFVKFPPVLSVSPKTGEISPKTFDELYFENPEVFKTEIENLKKNTKGLIPLGLLGTRLRFFSLETKQVQIISENSKMPLLLSMASEEFYKEKFGTTNCKKIIENLFDLSRNLPKYRSEKVKPAGCYIDSGKLIINCGDNFVENLPENPENIYLPQGSFFYEKTEKLNKQTIDFLKQIEDGFFINQHYTHKMDGYAILAWSILSLVAGAIEYKFMLGFYGEKGLWKSRQYVDFIKKLQWSYKEKSVNKSPAATFASFKSTIRNEGVTSFFFNEAEGDSYSENFYTFIRESFYRDEDSGLSQSGKDGEILTTHNDIMTGFTYNFRPHAWKSSDMSRLYEIEFYKRHNKKYNDCFSFLKKFNLPLIGRDLVCYLLTNFHKFKQYEQEFFIKQFSFLDGHELSVCNSIWSFYKVLNVFDDKFFDRYLKFLEKKLSMAEKLNNDKDVLNAVFSIEVFLSEFKESRSLRDILKNLPTDDRNFLWENKQKNLKFLLKFFKTYMVKFYPSDEKGICLALCGQLALYDSLKKIGINTMVASTLWRVIHKRFNANKNVSYDGETVRAAMIPLKRYLTENVLNFVEKNYKKLNK